MHSRLEAKVLSKRSKARGSILGNQIFRVDLRMRCLSRSGRQLDAKRHGGQSGRRKGNEWRPPPVRVEQLVPPMHDPCRKNNALVVLRRTVIGLHIDDGGVSVWDPASAYAMAPGDSASQRPSGS